MNTGQSIREQLEALAEEQYRIFASSLIPGKDNILGVRLPVLRKLAGEIVRGDWQAYLSQAADDSMEEVLLQGMVIGKCNVQVSEVLELIAAFIPKIDNWSVCDSFCAGLKIVNQNREAFWAFLTHYLQSEKEYEIRFGVVMLLDYYIIPEYLFEVFRCLDQIKPTGYYAKMAAAWAVSVCYVKFTKETLAYLENSKLDDFTYNKGLQKITECAGIDEQAKRRIKGMKRGIIAKR